MSTRTTRTHAQSAISGRKKIAAIVAIILSLAIGLGGALAFTDFGQSFINRFRGAGNPDILLHDDFEAGTNKDVYVENTGETPMIVRVRFAEYLQIGNTPIIGGNANDRSTWIVRMFNTAPADDDNYYNGANIDGALPTENRHIWYMTGDTKIYKPGTGEMGNYEYVEDQTFEDGTVAKTTLPASPVVLVQYYIDHKTDLDEKYPEGLWALDTDGYAYWTRALQPGEATNLLLDNVILDQTAIPDDNYYYAIDVRLEASNFTESYLLYTDGKTATPEGEQIIKDAVDAGTKTPPELTIEDFFVKVSGAATQAATKDAITLKLYKNAAEQVLTLTGIVKTSMSTKPGQAVWSQESGADWLRTAGKSVSVRVVVPPETIGEIVINAHASGDNGASGTVKITIIVVENTSTPPPAPPSEGSVEDGVSIVDGSDNVLPAAKAGDSVDWIAIAKQNKSGKSYYLIVRTKVVGTSPFDAERPLTDIYTNGDSELKKAIDAWWTGFNSGSALKSKAVHHNALVKLGTDDRYGYSYGSSPAYAGFSEPTDSGDTSTDAFPLSADEAARYLSVSWRDKNDDEKLNPDDSFAHKNWTYLKRKGDAGSVASWLRTPAVQNPPLASLLFTDGEVNDQYVSISNGIRPALWVSADIFN
ncbi:MAG: hypothetical protein LBB67_07910 [Oscillospiraceae bacterium]|jgi:hypothetical protein|nr:hypothetical protein [Oscillospiraceae bacterium]